jgi:DNA-binding CsgD family transcriptional regulator/PAS domain-containing protein
MEKMLGFSLDEPLVLSRINPEWRDSRVYRQWARPQGLIDVMAMPLSLDRAAAGSIGMGRHESKGEIGELEVGAAGLLLPHVQRAVAISRLLDIKSVVASGFAGALDMLAVGVVLTDADLGIIHANAAAAAMLSVGNPIRNERGLLSVRSPPVAAALGAAVRQAAADETGRGRRGLGIPAGARAAPCVLNILPLRHGAVRPGLMPRAVAAVFVSPAAAPVSVPFDALAALYDLTAAESRVFEQIAAGKTKLETAATLGIQPTTVKTHLEHIFLKTGTSRQLDLVKLAHCLALPL